MSERQVRAVVVDDEPAAREAIVTLLANEARVHVVAQAVNGRQAVELIRYAQPDLVFLDVQMPDFDGFQVLERLGPDIPPAVIFVTAHDAHALRAFDVHALDYLLKPFGRPRFATAVNRALERLAAHEALTIDYARAARSSASAPEPSLARLEDSTALRRIAVRNGSTTRLIDVDTLHWAEACGDYIRLHTSDESHLLSDSMQELERRLDPRRFLRVHRSIIVNLSRVRELRREPDGSGSLLLDGGVRLRVARGRWAALQEALGLSAVDSNGSGT